MFIKTAAVLTIGLAPVGATAGAKQGHDFQQAIQYMESKQYAKAVPLLEELAEKGNKAAMYRLAYIY
ncbi:hypothetical protein, partial [Hydrogenimonas sp.]